MLQPRKGRTAVNAHPRTPSQTLPTAAEEVLCHHSESFYPCPGGETGRRTGLKIPGPERDVPVRFRSRAPSELRDPSLRFGISAAGSRCAPARKAPQLKIPGPEESALSN